MPELEALEFINNNGFNFALADLQAFKDALKNDAGMEYVSGGSSNLNAGYVLTIPTKLFWYYVGSGVGAMTQGFKDGYRDAREGHLFGKSREQRTDIHN